MTKTKPVSKAQPAAKPVAAKASQPKPSKTKPSAVVEPEPSEAKASVSREDMMREYPMSDDKEINLEPLIEALKADGDAASVVLIKIVEQLKEAREVIESMHAASQGVTPDVNCHRVYQRWQGNNHG